ncbi:MAG: toprim domain-containing protein [Pseudomonadota bacterium]
MEKPASQISHRLGQQAEAVCRHYLSQGYREGRYWLVGNAHNVPGRSLYVRLVDMEKGVAGKWTDAATGEHGDLLDIIALNQGHHQLRDTLDEARRFLSLPIAVIDPEQGRTRPKSKVAAGSPAAAKRLFAASTPVHGAVAATYLRKRGITNLVDCDALRFHPRCYYRPSKDDAHDTRTAWPALIASVTDLMGKQTGVHRTWLDPNTLTKAPVASPRRAMGNILGHAIRFGIADDLMIAGEGIETMLSLREVMPDMPLAAATSSAHLAAILFPPTLKRLYVARDNDASGHAALAALTERTKAIGIEIIALCPQLNDFNDDLRTYGHLALGSAVAPQLHAADRTRFLISPY